ncbi:SDR family NAD(P)-dependent oxidoreductase [Streptomyces sp. BK79]|uniref:SDR family NAD(P)-dependent oxidoreductase n=1 Tax=Streptomyces sp. BK79 TaxID=3350097 RepID=UPI0037703FDB
MRRIDYRRHTVIVTGASSGLGAEFAQQLARRGANLVLVARRADRLQSLADELTRTHGVTVTVIARDLGLPDAGRALRAQLESRGIHATGLVNNAGFGTHDAFRNEDPERLQSMIALNVAALVDLSRAYIDPLASADNGILINVASLLGFQPTPYLSVYGATKAFVLSFTESLWEETRGTGLHVLAVCPGAVQTEFYDAAGSQSADYGSKRASVDHVVRTALGTLDRRSAPPSVITNGRRLALAGRFLPRRLVVRGMGWMARRAMHA